MGSPVISPSQRRFSTTESLLLLASEDVEDIENYGSIDREIEEISITKIPNIIQIEVSLLLNVFLAMFDSTITASTYATIGSEFNAANLGSWITTSYLITSTSFQPLYGSFSDILGRRYCYFFATIVFAIGCIGCSLSPDIFTLFFARALTGIGGGGLITLATVINSDIIPPSKRGLFQGFQNILIGLGSILGASLGGFIAENVGWRFCFLLQVPISLIGLIFGYFYINNQEELQKKNILENIDLLGSSLLVIGLTFQLLSLYSKSYVSYFLSISSFNILFWFYRVEITTTRTPIIPFKKVRTLSNYLVLFISSLTGFASMAYIFILPLLFQIVLNDSPSKAGLRLGIPSLFTSVGSLLTAFFMNKNIDNLVYLVFFGIFLLGTGNFLALLISKEFPQNLLNFLLIPANTGLGVCNPALLFTFVFSFPRNLQASSTSTLYLFRAIGSVYGVAVTSTILLKSLRFQLVKNFNGLDLDQHEIDEIIVKAIRSISFIKTLPPEIEVIVSKSYEASIRHAQLISSLICVFAFILSIIKTRLQKEVK